jgi:hypothetical protein
MVGMRRLAGIALLGLLLLVAVATMVGIVIHVKIQQIGIRQNVILPICEPSGTCSRDLVGQTVWDEYQNNKG